MGPAKATPITWATRISAATILGLLLLAGSLLVACGGSNEADQDGSPKSYMEEVGSILQKVRALNDRIEAAIPDGTVDLPVVAGLIESDFKPTLTGLRQRALDLTPDANHQKAHQALLTYLDLRLQAYEAILQTQDQKDLQHLQRFPALEAQADSLGADLELQLRQLRHR